MSLGVLATDMAFFGVILAAIPAVLVLLNLLFYRRPRTVAGKPVPISVLIPARDEEASIGPCVRAVLASREVELEVVVMDDGSRDRTAEVVAEIAAEARESNGVRVRLLSAPAPTAGWCGKQHACHVLAQAARHQVLVFLDADVRLEPDGLARLLGCLESRQVDLVSGIPRQETGTWLEHQVVPLIHFVLLGFLPMAGMRWTRLPAFAAGCGQLFMVRREAYRASGGHAAIRASRHDGLQLPRAFRAAGRRTDLCDVTDLATCRMYRGAREVWNGFAKNADEGMASVAAIGPWSVLLLGGQVVPPLLLGLCVLAGTSGPPLPLALLATSLAWGTRALLAWRFRQSWSGVLFHPVGVAVVVAIQWYALWSKLQGRQIAWKGRLGHGTWPGFRYGSGHDDWYDQRPGIRAGARNTLRTVGSARAGGAPGEKTLSFRAK